MPVEMISKVDSSIRPVLISWISVFAQKSNTIAVSFQFSEVVEPGNDLTWDTLCFDL